MKTIRNQFALAVCVAALFVQFLIFEPYIYQDAFKEFTQFNNNFVWMYAIFFVIGAVIYSLRSKNKRGNAGIRLAVWGSLVTLTGCISLPLLQTLLRHVKINSLTMIMPLIYCVLLCFAATVQYATFDCIVRKIVSDKRSVILPVCIAVFVVSVVLIIIPYHLSYKAVIIMSGILLMASAFIVDNHKETDSTVMFINIDSEDNNRTGKGMIAWLFIEPIIFMFGLAILLANIGSFAEYYAYRSQDLSILFIVVSISAFAGRKMYLKCNANRLFPVLSAIIYFVALVVMTFTRSYIFILLTSAIASISGTIQISYFIKAVQTSGYMKKKIYVAVSIIAVTLSFMLGYWAGVYMTMGGGQMTDILAGIYLEPIRTNSMIAKGLVPDASGNYVEYAGIGERIALSYKRFEYHPSSYVILISAAVCEVAFIINTVLYYFVGRNKVKAQ